METSRAGWVKMEQSDRCRNQHLWISWGKKTQSPQRGNCSIKSRISADLVWLSFDALPFSRRDTIRGFAAKLNRIEWAPEIKISNPQKENLWISADLKKIPTGRDGVGTPTLKFSRQHFSHVVRNHVDVVMQFSLAG